MFYDRGGVHTMIFKVCQALDIILKEKEIQWPAFPYDKHESEKSCEGQENPEGKGQWTSSMPLDQGNSYPGKTNVLEAP